MTSALAYPIALIAAVPTTLCVLGLWVLHARFIDGNSVDSVFLPFVFLFVTLIFFVSIVANLAAVAIGQVASLAAPRLSGWATIGAAGVLVCVRSVRGRSAARGGCSLSGRPPCPRCRSRCSRSPT